MLPALGRATPYLVNKTVCLVQSTSQPASTVSTLFVPCLVNQGNKKLQTINVYKNFAMGKLHLFYRKRCTELQGDHNIVLRELQVERCFIELQNSFQPNSPHDQLLHLIKVCLGYFIFYLSY